MLKVLLIDDEPVFRQLLMSYIKSDGFEAKAAGNGVEAMELLKRFDPDVLVVDWMLNNHLHGLEVIQICHRLKPRIPVILISGYPSKELRTKAEKCGVSQFLAKPFQPEDLVVAIRQAAKPSLN